MDDELKAAAPTALLPPRPASPAAALDEASFRHAFAQALADEPREAGLRHPGEALLRRALGTSPDHAPDWVARLYHEAAATRPALAVGLVRCLGRLPQAVALLRAPLAAESHGWLRRYIALVLDDLA